MEHVKRSTFKLLFYLKKNEPKKNGNVPVMGRITIDGTPKTFGTKLEINPETWDLKHGRVLGKSNLAININQKLDKIRVRINKIYEDMMKDDGFATSQKLTASKYPERIKAVVVEAAHIFVEDVTLKGIYEAMDAYKNTDLAERLAKYHGDKVDTLFKAWTETWTRSDYRDWNIEDFLPAITSPLLFIQGEADEYGTLEQVEKTISQVSGKTEKYIIPGIGHTPHKENKTLIAEIAGKFINQI